MLECKKPVNMKNLCIYYYVFLFVTTILITIENSNAENSDCHGKICNTPLEYCSIFTESCDNCSNICNSQSHNYQKQLCAKECSGFKQYQPLELEIRSIQTQQTVILILLIIILVIICIRNGFKCFLYLRKKQCILTFLKKIHPRKQQTPSGKATTIQNVMTVNELERTLSPSSSITVVEPSVATATTPISRRYPAEDSSSPGFISEFSYENQALSVTPVFEKSPPVLSALKESVGTK